MIAIRRRNVDQALNRLPAKPAPARDQIAREIEPGVYRLPVPVEPRPKEEAPGAAVISRDVGDIRDQDLNPVGSPDARRGDVVDTSGELDKDDEAAPYAWAGMLICAVTAAVTASGIAAVVF